MSNEFDGLNEAKESKNMHKYTEMKFNVIEDLKDEVTKKGTDVKENMAAPQILYNISSDVPVAVVIGEPLNTSHNLDFKQGDNPFHAQGNCGLVSITNLLRMSGLNVTENDITKYALDNHLCSNPFFGRDGDRGGTTPDQRLEVLMAFGIEARSFNTLPINEVADAVENGKGVLMSVNAGYLWDEPAYVKDPMGNTHSNHCITITGVARNPSNGEVAGLYICDSGRGEQGDSQRFVSVNELNRCYTTVPGTTVQITNNPIR